MKSIIVIPLGIVLAISLYGCTSEMAGFQGSYTDNRTANKSLGTPAANIDNPYDHTGIAYRELLSNYKAGQFNPSDFTDIHTIVHSLLNMPTFTGTAAKQSLLSSCINDPMGTIQVVLSVSGLSLESKALLSGLVEDYEALGLLPFDDAYTELVAIESGVLNSLTLPDYEQRIILRVTSILRYSLYHSCCEDTDWGKSVGNIVAATAGAISGEHLAIEYILITSIAGLEKIHI